MTAGTENPIVRTTVGALRGTRENRICVFRGIPYAAPPIGILRFKPPHPTPVWDGARDATVDGPVAPQLPSRLAHVMGNFDRPQSEDCLTLNVWTPQPVTGGALRPVMVWIHGGAFLSGAGSLPWYAGDRFAQDGVVAVSINYRLGPLGFLCLPGVSEANLGFQDQIAALRWVHDNIAAFGGDPKNVTVVGQSAGASSIAAHILSPQSRGLFQRAIMQSTPFGRGSRSLEEAHRIGRRFLEVLGLRQSEAEGVAQIPVERLLQATGQLARLEKKLADVSPPFSLVIDGRVIPREIMPTLEGGWSAEVDLMIGTTREEMTAFFASDPAVRNADAAAVASVFAAILGPGYRTQYDELHRMRASDASASVLGDLMSDHVFRLGSLQLAECQELHGRAAYVYEFDWQSPAGFEACHCLELPFVFANLANWSGAPMLRGADAREMDGLAHAMHGAWNAFIQSGDPNHADLPHWVPYRQLDRITMRFDRVIGPVRDLAGLEWRQPWPRLPGADPVAS